MLIEATNSSDLSAAVTGLLIALARSISFLMIAVIGCFVSLLLKLYGGIGRNFKSLPESSYCRSQRNLWPTPVLGPTPLALVGGAGQSSIQPWTCSLADPSENECSCNPRWWTFSDSCTFLGTVIALAYYKGWLQYGYFRGAMLVHSSWLQTM